MSKLAVFFLVAGATISAFTFGARYSDSNVKVVLCVEGQGKGGELAAYRQASAQLAMSNCLYSKSKLEGSHSSKDTECLFDNECH